MDNPNVLRMGKQGAYFSVKFENKRETIAYGFRGISLSNDCRIHRSPHAQGVVQRYLVIWCVVGCRFNHEVIQWNTYTPEQSGHGLEAFGCTMNQILVPLLPNAIFQHVEGFIHSNIFVPRDSNDWA